MSDRVRRFTAQGSTTVERRVASIVDGVVQVVASKIPLATLRALVLIGGYGRGEGGVEVRAGAEHPHNNLDFLMIVNAMGRARREELERVVQADLRALALEAGVGIDLSVASAASLRWARPLVMWYDMRLGHRTVLGDASFVPSLRRFRLDRVPAIDMLRLMVNRGTLLLINEQILDRTLQTEEERRSVVRHTMKAIIGYGDAHLFANGQYDWSYVEKQRRFEFLPNTGPRLKALYAEATEFRFRPQYDTYLEFDLGEWMRSIRAALQPVHLDFERWRLGQPGLDWSQYPATALTRGILGTWHRPREFASMLWQLNCGRETASSFGPLVTSACRLTRAADVLALAYPIIAYDLADPDLRRFAAQVLALADSDPDPVCLRRGYLRAWSHLGDRNFVDMAEQIGLTTAESRWGT